MIDFNTIDNLIEKDIKGDLTYGEVKELIDNLGLVLGNHGDDYMCDCSNAEAYECWHFQGDDFDKRSCIYVEFDYNHAENGDRTPGAVHHIDIEEYMLVSKGLLEKRKD